MATQSVMKDIAGPDWPLGLVTVATPGTPVPIMSLVDSGLIWAPQTATSYSVIVPEYTVRFQQIWFQALRAGASHGTASSTGNVYILRKGVQGAGNRDDYGALVYVLGSGLNFFLGSAASNRDVFNPYRYYIDADNAGDGALITGLVQ